MKDIEDRVRSHWRSKKQVKKHLQEAVLDRKNRENRLAAWADKAQGKKTNLPEMKLEDNRIEILESIEVTIFHIYAIQICLSFLF